MIDPEHLEKKRIEALCSFAKIRREISKQIEMDQAVKIYDELLYLERLFKNMFGFLEQRCCEKPSFIKRWLWK